AATRRKKTSQSRGFFFYRP
ncbi:TPA: hypothetical protein I4D63_06220, partial [Enterobacter hormaechei]|nr:hypothetical protein [Enterobacter hormaechei]